VQKGVLLLLTIRRYGKRIKACIVFLSYNGDILTKTEENLKKALAGESQARAKYVKWAGVANKEGHQAVAKIFLETAEN